MKLPSQPLIQTNKIKQVKQDTVNTEVTLKLADGTEIVSIITKESTERLGLSKSKEAYAVIKASSVMIALD
ncbi:MAG: TOBE domain-containing protein [Dehalococcoidales bacterium]|nr:TOBE domain-containing protein [Dehalococcoidales bacterium]